MTPTKQWQLAPQNKALAKKLASHCNISPFLAQLLLNRQLNSLDDVQHYLYPPTETAQFDRSLLTQILALINTCIQNQKPIFLYGDYDVDGMTSVTMMAKALTAIGAVVRYKIPHRFKDGYGLNTSIIELMNTNQCGLLITLDCGITNCAEIEAINDQTDADIIIIDHHQIPSPSPNANVILNPKSENTPPSLSNLCTAGIVYKFIEYLSDSYDVIKCSDYCDLAALGTIADVVPLKKENRHIVRKGLPLLSKRKNHGIKALLTCANNDNTHLSTRDVGFTIAPRLNAAGRLSDAQLGVDLLLSQTDQSALTKAKHLESLNQQRRELDTAVVAESIDTIENSPDYQRQSILVLGNKNWHAGVIGIAASKLVSRYSKPVVIVGIDESIARGSARSFGNVNIYALLKECTQYLNKFGGHKQAAGFSLNPANFGQFKQALETYTKTQVKEHMLTESITADMSVSGKDITEDLINDIDKLNPFGHENTEPLFYSNTFDIIDSRLVGTGNHLKLTLNCKESNKTFDAIGFSLGEKLSCVYNKTHHLLFSIEKNYWNGQERLQLNIKDIK